MTEASATLAKLVSQYAVVKHRAAVALQQEEQERRQQQQPNVEDADKEGKGHVG